MPAEKQLQATEADLVPAEADQWPAEEQMEAADANDKDKLLLQPGTAVNKIKVNFFLQHV